VVVLKMPSSRKIIEKQSADQLAINYVPITIDSQMSEQAHHYVEKKDMRGDFRVDPVVAEYVGIDELEKESQKKEVAQQALTLSKEIQEKAYREAYNLGLEEGRQKAYDEEKQRLASEMQIIRDLIEEIRTAKTEIYKSNEKQIVNLCYYMAKRLLMKEIETNEAYIETLIRKTLEMAQSDEEVTIRVSKEDKNWVEMHAETVFSDLNLDSSTRIEEDSQVQRGGVIVETNHGMIDATVEQRLEKLETIVTKQG
jgi:flagellar assembly protein FliH